MDYNELFGEIKPKSNTTTVINTLKRNALLKWCDDNNYTYSEITEEYFIENFNKENELLKKYNFKSNLYSGIAFPIINFVKNTSII